MSVSRRAQDDRIASIIIAGLTSLIVLYPPWYAYWKLGSQGLFRFVKGDAMLYLAIGKRSTQGFFTFDGETVTNGFHPLWQWILTFALRFTEPADTASHLLISFALSTFLVCAGLVLCGLAIHRYTHSIFLSMLTVPGVYYLFFGSEFDNHHAWQSIDGMESGLSIFFGGLILYLMARHSTREGITHEDLLRIGPDSVVFQIGLVLPFLVLSRLDDVFILPALCIAILLLPGAFAKRIRALFVLCAPTGLLLVAYVLYNKLSAGTFLPISGVAKGGVAVASAAYIFLTGVFPPLIDLKNALSARQSLGLDLYQAEFRCIQMLLPAFFAFAYIVLAGRRLRTHSAYAIPAGLAFYVIIKSAYNFFNVQLWHQGTWYYAFSMLLVTFFVATLLGDCHKRLAQNRLAAYCVYAFYTLLVLLVAGRVLEEKLYVEKNAEYVFWNDRTEIGRALTEAAGDAGIIEFDDGIVNFSLERPSIHGFVFAGDLETFRAREEGRLLQHAFDRGYSILTAIGAYMPVERPMSSSEEIRAFLKTTYIADQVKQEFDRFDFETIYMHEKTKTAFFRFHPR